MRRSLPAGGGVEMVFSSVVRFSTHRGLVRAGNLISGSKTRKLMFPVKIWGCNNTGMFLEAPVLFWD